MSTELSELRLCYGHWYHIVEARLCCDVIIMCAVKMRRREGSSVIPKISVVEARCDLSITASWHRATTRSGTQRNGTSTARASDTANPLSVEPKDAIKMKRMTLRREHSMLATQANAIIALVILAADNTLRRLVASRRHLDEIRHAVRL